MTGERVHWQEAERSRVERRHREALITLSNAMVVIDAVINKLKESKGGSNAKFGGIITRELIGNIREAMVRVNSGERKSELVERADNVKADLIAAVETSSDRLLKVARSIVEEFVAKYKENSVNVKN